MSVHEFRVKDIDGTERSLGDFSGKALLVVNVASRCGLTPQYSALQALYEKYHARGLEVLGFPCNQFAGQEPGSEDQIKAFCSTNYQVTFSLFSKLEVNGPGRSALYAWLTQQASQPESSGDIQWNFTKFVIGRDGEVRGRFSPQTAPDSSDLLRAIEVALG